MVSPQDNAPDIVNDKLSKLRTAYQLSVYIPFPDDNPAFPLCDNVVREIVGWIGTICPEPLPEDAYAGKSFKWDHHALFTATGVAIPARGIRSLRFVSPVEPFAEKRVVPGRNWIVEFALRQQDDGLLLAVQVHCASTQHSAWIPVQRQCPDIVRTLASNFRLEETLVITKSPWIIDTEEGLLELYEAIADPTRMMPIWVISQPARSLPYPINGDALSERGYCIAHTVLMPWKLTFKWKELVSQDYSVYGGAVRTYNPGIGEFQQPPYMHPWANQERIREWRHKGIDGKEAYADFLWDKAIETLADQVVDFGECLFTADAEVTRSRLARESFQRAVKRGESAEQLGHELEEQRSYLELYRQEVEALENKLAQTKDDYGAALRMANEWDRQKTYYQQENHALRALAATLRDALKRKSGETKSDAYPEQVSYDDIPQWVEENLVDRLVLHSRARQSLKKAMYENVDNVCDCILLLANEYRDMRLGMPGGKENFNEKLISLGVELSGAISGISAGEFGEEYYVTWPPGTQRTCFIEWHLRNGGNSRDPRRCLRIYFFWDDDSNRVVVASLPGHLRNQLS